jgi:hypothetical protein
MGNEGSQPDERTRRQWQPWDGTKVVATPTGTRREPPPPPPPAPAPARAPVQAYARPANEPAPPARRSRLVWWPVPAAIALAAVAAYLLTRPDDGAKRGSPAPARTAQVAGAAHTKMAAVPATPRVVGTLSARGGDLLPLPAGGDLERFRGAYVAGRGVPVQSVVGNEAFWIGASREQRVLVRVVSARGESSQTVKVGMKVSFAAAGVTRVTPRTARRLGISAREGAGQLRRQGVYLAVLERKLRLSSS